jgi:hypothetical protein
MGKIITKSDEIESNIVLENCKMESDQCKLWMYAYAVRYGAHLLDDMARALCYGPSPELRSEGVQITVSLLKADLEYVGQKRRTIGRTEFWNLLRLEPRSIFQARLASHVVKNQGVRWAEVCERLSQYPSHYEDATLVYSLLYAGDFCMALFEFNYVGLFP